MPHQHHPHDHAPDHAAPQAHDAPTDLHTESAPAAETKAPEAAPDSTAEIANLKEQVLRAMAETENTRRRMKKEIDDMQKYAVGNFAKDILAVADNFQRALDALPKDTVQDAAIKNLITGLEATDRQLISVLERFGIKKIDALGHPFDPHFHRVMMEQEDLSKPAGTVTAVMQSGYMIHDRLLREALVMVSKGGPVAHKVDTSA